MSKSLKKKVNAPPLDDEAGAGLNMGAGDQELQEMKPTIKRKGGKQEGGGDAQTPFQAMKGLLDHDHENDIVSDGRPSTEGGPPNRKGRSGKYN
jgi:hypothetical protein